MTEVPTTAYSLLEPFEKQQVDDYVQYAINEQHRKRERIIHALAIPIPAEYIKRSKNALYKPLVRAAIAERIKHYADEQDISPSRVIREHASIAFSDIGDFVESSGFGDFRVKDLDNISPEKRGAIKSIETSPGPYGLKTKVVLHDKHPSLKAMGEMMGLVTPDKPPPLLEYVRPPALADKSSEETNVEKLYADLIGS